jgi:hypothetical protein
MGSSEPEKKDPTKYTTDKRGRFRPDLLFSYWIFLWFLIYYFTDRKSQGFLSTWISENMNPIYLLYIAFLENIFTFLFILVINPNIRIIIQYLFMMLAIKVLPIYLLWGSPIKNKIRTVGFSIGSFLLYLFYLYLNNTDFIEVYKRTFTSVMKNRGDTPIFYIMHRIQDYFSR